jgi:hypothetical protein
LSVDQSDGSVLGVGDDEIVDFMGFKKTQRIDA